MRIQYEIHNRIIQHWTALYGMRNEEKTLIKKMRKDTNVVQGTKKKPHFKGHKWREIDCNAGKLFLKTLGILSSF